jgi:hypothetical protein
MQYKTAMKPTIYCLCTKDKMSYQSSENQKNMILKAFELSESEKNALTGLGFLFDDIGNNISELNRYFGQLTGLYWTWKNSTDPYVGTCTYRIFWKDDILLGQNDLIIPNPITVLVDIAGELIEGYDIKEQYKICHGDIMLKFLYGVLRTENLPITCDMMDYAMSKTQLHPYNMFVAKKETFDRICEILFSVLFSLYNNFGDFFPTLEYKIQQIRFLDFLAERILHTIFVNASTLLPNINISEMDTVVLPRI